MRDPSQYVTRSPCPNEEWLSLDQTLSSFPRHGFDYVWLIDPPDHDVNLTRGLQPIWRDGTSVLYRVIERRQPPAPPFATSL